MSYINAQRKRPWTVWVVIVAVLAATTGCFNGNGHDRYPSEQRFRARNNDEAEALRRMRDAIGRSAALLVDPNLSVEDKQRLSQAIDASRRALDRYEELRSRGENRVVVFAGIGKASAAIVADDVTGVGAADNFLLVAAGLGVIATYILTDAAASSDALAQAWFQVGYRIQELSTTLDYIVHMTARGNVADTGIMEEANELIRTGRVPRGDICAALAILYKAAEDAGDKRRMLRIRATQKYHDCRPSRHRRRL